MAKLNTYNPAIPASADYLAGIDKSNVTNDPNGEVVLISMKEIVMTRTVETVITSAAYTVTDSDVNGIVSMNVASANEVTIPSNTTNPNIPIGATIMISQEGAGTTTIKAAAGVTLRSVSGGSCAFSNRHGSAVIRKRSANAWMIYGDVGTVA